MSEHEWSPDGRTDADRSYQLRGPYIAAPMTDTNHEAAVCPTCGSREPQRPRSVVNTIGAWLGDISDCPDPFHSTATLSTTDEGEKS